MGRAPLVFLGALLLALSPSLSRADGEDVRFSRTSTTEPPTPATAPRPADAPRWLVALDLSPASHGLEPTALVVLPEGDILAAASFFGALTVGGVQHDARGGSDAALLRVGPDGQTRWTRTFGGTSSDAILALAPAAGGEAYVGGAWSSPEAATAEATSDAPAADETPRFFLMRVDGAGTPRWTAEPLGPHRNRSQINAIAETSDGGVIVAGTFRGVLRLDARTRLVAPYSGGFVAAYDGETGTLRWARSMEGREGSLTAALAIEGGDVLVAGSFRRHTDLGAGRVTGHGDLDTIVARFDANGRARWSKAYGSANRERPVALHPQPDGTVLLILDSRAIRARREEGEGQMLAFRLRAQTGRANGESAIALEEGFGTVVTTEGVLLVAGVAPATAEQARPGLVLHAGGSDGAVRATSRSVDARELSAPVWVALQPSGEAILFAGRRAPNGARGAILVALPTR